MKRFLTTAVIALIAGSASAVTFVPLSGAITVTTSSNRRNAAVTVSNNGTTLAQFCLSFPQPLDQPINISEKGQVIYLPQPIEGLSPGMQISGPEPIAQTLTVIPVKGSAFAFVAKGVQPIYKDAKVVVITNVSRQDGAGREKTKRVLGDEDCGSGAE